MAKQKKVLVIDDEYFVCKSIQKILNIDSVETEFATSGREGVIKSRNTDYDLVIIDIKMPEMNGYAVARMLQDIKPELPIIVISGYNTSHTEKQALLSGGCEFLPKPFTPEELKGVVDKYLSEESSQLLIAAKKERFVSSPISQSPETQVRDYSIAVGYACDMPEISGGDIYFEEQKINIREYADKNGLTLIALYEDRNSSDNILKRPAIHEILESEKKAGILLVDSICYISRNKKELRSLLELLDCNGMRLNTVSFLMDSMSQFARKWYEKTNTVQGKGGPVAV